MKLEIEYAKDQLFQMLDTLKTRWEREREKKRENDTQVQRILFLGIYGSSVAVFFMSACVYRNDVDD